MNVREIYSQVTELMKQEKYEDAYNILDTKIKSGIESPDLYSLRGVARLHLGKVNQALEDMNKAVELEPDYSYRYASRAYIKESLGMTKEAVEDYEIATRLDPDDPIAYNNLGLLQEKLGHMNKAKKYFRRADELEGILQENNISTQDEIKEENTIKAEENKEDLSKWILIKSVFTNKKMFSEFKTFVKNGFRN